MARTSVVNCSEEHDVYIGRPSKWGNPFIKGEHGNRTEVIAKYADWIQQQPELLAAIPLELKGKRLACWCKPAKSCHGDVLARLADLDEFFD